MQIIWPVCFPPTKPPILGPTEDQDPKGESLSQDWDFGGVETERRLRLWGGGQDQVKSETIGGSRLSQDSSSKNHLFQDPDFLYSYLLSLLLIFTNKIILIKH